MNKQDKNQLIKSLQNGIGFTYACDLCLLEPKVVTDYIRNNKDYHTEIITAVKGSAIVNLNYAETLRNEGKYREWRTQQRLIKDFISDLTLWEEYSTRDKVDPKIVSRATMIYKTVEECSTALGFNKREFVEYIFNNPDLLRYLQDSSVYNF